MTEYEAGQGIMCALHEQAVKDIKDALGRIETQTIATNGRIRSLERWRLVIICTIFGMIVGSAGGKEIVLRAILAIVGAG